MYVHTSPCTLFNIILTKLTSPVPNTQIPKPGDWGFHYNAVGMIPFDHPANQIDQVDSEIKDINPYLLGVGVDKYLRVLRRCHGRCPYTF